MKNKPKIHSNDLDQVPKTGERYENELNNPEIHEQIIETFDKYENISTDKNKFKNDFIIDFKNDFQKAGYDHISISENDNHISFLETFPVDLLNNYFPNIQQNPLETYMVISPSHEEGNPLCYISMIAPYDKSKEIQKILFDKNRGMIGGELKQIGFNGDVEVCWIRGGVGKMELDNLITD